jgi:hypothetical protein
MHPRAIDQILEVIHRLGVRFYTHDLMPDLEMLSAAQGRNLYDEEIPAIKSGQV